MSAVGSAVDGFVDGFKARSGELSFLDRLDDFRGRLIASAVVLIVTVGLGFCVAAWPVDYQVPLRSISLGRFGQFSIGGWTIHIDVLNFFVEPIRPYLDGEKLKYLSPTDPFFVTLKLGICIGFVLALPYLLHQLWGLVSPLMRPDERKLAGPSLLGGVLLFVTGAVFCYYMVIPLMLQFTLGFQTASLEQQIVIGEYMKIILRMILAFGLAFELPIIVVIGTALRLLTPEILSNYRRHSIAVMTVLSAIVTPPDLSSLVLLLVPVWFLYEVSIVLSRIIVARRPASAGAGV